MITALAIDRSLSGRVDPIFGGPLSLPEERLWEHILLGVRRRRRTWREWLGQGLSLFQPLSSPFGPSSGGAGGSVTSAQLADGGNTYPWLYPTSDFVNFDKYGTVALGAAAALTSIGGTVANNVIALNAASNMPWFVPKGFNGFIKTLALDFVVNGGAAWTQGVLPPQLQFQMAVNQQFVYDYAQFFFSPAPVTSPTPIAGIPIKEQNLVQMFVTNLTLANTTQFVEARLQGYYYGKSLEPKNLAF